MPRAAPRPHRRGRRHAHGAEVRSVRRPDASAGARLSPAWRRSVAFTKLHAWNLTEFDRVLFLDADSAPPRPPS